MLALVGSGEYLPPMEAVDRYLLGQLTSEPHVICLPTAAGTEGLERITYWMELGKSHFSRLGVEVESLPVVDQASANDPALAERIRQANFIYLSGGKPERRTDAWPAAKADYRTPPSRFCAPRGPALPESRF